MRKSEVEAKVETLDGGLSVFLTMLAHSATDYQTLYVQLPSLLQFLRVTKQYIDDSVKKYNLEPSLVSISTDINMIISEVRALHKQVGVLKRKEIPADIRATQELLSGQLNVYRKLLGEMPDQLCNANNVVGQQVDAQIAQPQQPLSYAEYLCKYGLIASIDVINTNERHQGESENTKRPGMVYADPMRTL